MRLLKFIGVFVVTTILLLAFVLGLNWSAFQTFLDNREAFMEGTDWVPKTQSLRGLSEYIEENPQHVSVASMVVEHPDSVILFEADTPRTMGTMSNLLLLSAWGIALERGDYTLDETLSVEEVGRYSLPQVDSALHREMLEYARKQGWVTDRSITLDNAFRLLALFNDLPLSDYLWHRIDEEVWMELKERYGLDQTELPLPFSGLYIGISAFETPFEENLESWAGRDRSEFRDHVAELSDRYLNDSDWRQQVQEYMEKHRLGITFMQERDAMQLFPQATAREMMGMMQQLWDLDREASDGEFSVLNYLRLPFENRSEIERDFTDYGALFDNRMGILNGADFGTLVYTGNTNLQVIFYDRLPIGFWFHMSGNHMHQDFQQRLIYDPALVVRMADVAGVDLPQEIND